MIPYALYAAPCVESAVMHVHKFLGNRHECAQIRSMIENQFGSLREADRLVQERPPDAVRLGIMIPATRQ